jgi:hypothetical protein
VQTTKSEALGGNIMIAIRQVRRPSGGTTGEKIVALQYNMAATDPQSGERCPAFGKYILREYHLAAHATEEKVQRFIEKYYGGARIFRI